MEPAVKAAAKPKAAPKPKARAYTEVGWVGTRFEVRNAAQLIGPQDWTSPEGTMIDVPWTCTHAGCYATVFVLSLHTCGMFRLSWGGDVDVPWTCAHAGCYATVFVLSLHTCWMLRNFPRKLARGPDATVHPEIPQMVQQWMWRTNLGPATPETFLVGPKDAVRQLWEKASADQRSQFRHSIRIFSSR